MEENDLNDPIPEKKTKKKIPLAVKAVAKVMTESGFSQVETARELSLPVKSIQRAIADSTLDRKIIEQVKEILPTKFYHVAFMIAERLSSHPELIAKMNPYMQTMVMAIMVDKGRLMQGQSTENVEVRGQVADVKTTLDEIARIKNLLVSKKNDQKVN